MIKKILVIDDDSQDRKGMGVALEKAGYAKVRFAEKGTEAIEVVNSFRPDIILVDVVLVEEDGFDVCRQIRAIKGFRPLIIMITGHLEAIIAEKARNSGADEIIEKIPGFTNIGPTIDQFDK